MGDISKKIKIVNSIDYKKIFNFCFLFLVTNFFINTCMPLPFAKGIIWWCILNIGYIFMLCVDFIFLIRYSSTCRRILKSSFDENKSIIIFVTLYLIWDLINFTYATYLGYTSSKILSIIENLLLLINLLIFINWSHINRVFLCIGLVSLFISATAIVGFVTGDYCYYLRKISILKDYNVFATVILLGTIANFYIITRGRVLSFQRCVLLYLTLLLNVPVILLSGSRKNFLIICVVMFFYLIVFFGKSIYQTQKKLCVKDGTKKRFLLLLVGVLSILSVVGMTSWLSNYSDSRYEEYLSGNYMWVRYTDKVDGRYERESSVRESDLNGRYETLISGKAANGRIVIWKTSMEWIKDMSPLEKIIGGGNSYNSEVFDDIDHPINRECKNVYGSNITNEAKNWLYPHNIVLGDMLDGGIIKVFLLCGVVLTMIYKVLTSILYRSEMGIAVLWVGGTILVMLMTSGHLGLFGNKFFWAPLALTLGLEQRQTCKAKTLGKDTR